jgi:hypothetical protein
MPKTVTSTSDIPAQFLLIKSASAVKLGQRGVGQIHFQLLASLDRQQLFLRISGNDGSGAASDEAVSFETLQEAINRVDAGTAFGARIFRDCYVGRSVNNFSFACCCLRSLDLLAASDKLHKHVQSGDWPGFIQMHLQLHGEMIDIGKQALPLPADTAEPVAKTQRKDKRKKIALEESAHACSV